jgi:hypothetical protein
LSVNLLYLGKLSFLVWDYLWDTGDEARVLACAALGAFMEGEVKTRTNSQNPKLVFHFTPGSSFLGSLSCGIDLTLISYQFSH